MPKPLYVIIPDELYEKLRQYTFENKTDKKTVITKLLTALLTTKPKPEVPFPPVPPSEQPIQPPSERKPSFLDKIFEKKDSIPFE